MGRKRMRACEAHGGLLAQEARKALETRRAFWASEYTLAEIRRARGRRFLGKGSARPFPSGPVHRSEKRTTIA